MASAAKPPADMPTELFPKLSCKPLLQGQTLVLAGTFQGPLGKKTVAEGAICAAGGKVTGSPSSKTTMVVYGHNPGEKHMVAAALGARVVHEKQLSDAMAAGELPAEPMPAWAAGFWANDKLSRDEKLMMVYWVRRCYLSPEEYTNAGPFEKWTKSQYCKVWKDVEWPGWSRLTLGPYLSVLQDTLSRRLWIDFDSFPLTIGELDAVLGVVVGRAAEKVPLSYLRVSGDAFTAAHLQPIAKWLPSAGFTDLDIRTKSVSADGFRAFFEQVNLKAHPTLRAACFCGQKGTAALCKATFGGPTWDQEGVRVSGSDYQ